jgi:hypothetical protein
MGLNGQTKYILCEKGFITYLYLFLRNNLPYIRLKADVRHSLAPKDSIG